MGHVEVMEVQREFVLRRGVEADVSEGASPQITGGAAGGGNPATSSAITIAVPPKKPYGELPVRLTRIGSSSSSRPSGDVRISSTEFRRATRT